MSLFQDKIAFVTGAGSGLGRALCQELARRGAIVVVTDLDEDSAARVAAEIESAGGRSFAMKLDVSESANVIDSIDRIVAKYGQIDYVFNNAGIIILGEVRDMELEHWHRIINVNLLGVLYGTTAAYSHMVRQGHGHIVNIASLAGLTPLPAYAAYSTTKHAVVGLSTSLRPEASRLGVKISVVCPGIVNTGLGVGVTILRANRELLQGGPEKKPQGMDPADAIAALLRGVERNQAVIVFPFGARLLWRLYRIQPALLAPLEWYFFKVFRAARTES